MLLPVLRRAAALAAPRSCAMRLPMAAAVLSAGAISAECAGKKKRKSLINLRVYSDRNYLVRNQIVMRASRKELDSTNCV